MKVILASGSPRRRELMEMLGIRCKVQASGAEEVVTSAEPEKVVEELSRLKCLDVAEITEGDAVVIGADTVVAFEGEILGKPKGIDAPPCPSPPPEKSPIHHRARGTYRGGNPYHSGHTEYQSTAGSHRPGPFPFPGGAK